MKHTKPLVLATACVVLFAGCDRGADPRATSSVAASGTIAQPAEAMVDAPDAMRDATQGVGSIDEMKPVDAGYLDATYSIEGTPVRLQKGRFEGRLEGAMHTVTVRGTPVMTDLDRDGDLDVALLLQQTGAGSGSFTFLVAAVQDNGTWRGSDAVLLGDRVAVPVISIHKRGVEVRFLAHGEDQPMAEPPTQERKFRAELVGLHLEVPND